MLTWKNNVESSYINLYVFLVGSISPSMTIPTTSTSSIETPDPCPTNTMCPSMMSMVDKDETGMYVSVYRITGRF